MNVKTFLSELAHVLEVEPGTVTPEFRLNDCIFDSVAVVATLGLIDEYFGTSVNGNDLRRCRSVGDLLELVGCPAEAGAGASAAAGGETA